MDKKAFEIPSAATKFKEIKESIPADSSWVVSPAGKKPSIKKIEKENRSLKAQLNKLAERMDQLEQSKKKK